jgi:hypothetical protein
MTRPDGTRMNASRAYRRCAHTKCSISVRVDATKPVGLVHDPAPLCGYPSPVSSKRVPAGAVRDLPTDLREALIAKVTALADWTDITPLARASSSAGRGCQTRDDSKAAASTGPGGAGGRPAPVVLMARVQAPRAHRQ